MLEKIIGVYEIKNLVNGKYYIGSSNNVKRRWKEHVNQLNSSNHHNMYLQNSWNKYGEENFRFQILEYVNNEKFLREAEEQWIHNLKSYEREVGYNISIYTDSPLRGVKLREETINKLKNKIFTKQHKLNISKAKKDKKLTKEHKSNISDGLTGRIYTTEARKNMSKALQGDNHPNNKLTKKEKASVITAPLRFSRIFTGERQTERIIGCSSRR